MPGIEWVNTVDNRSFVQGMNEMQASFRRTSEILKSLGQNFNIDGIVNQYISLTKVIQDNEVAIRQSRESVLRWQEQAQKARDAGNFGTAETIQIDIDNELQKIQQLSEETDEYKRSVNELMGLWSNLEGKKAPMLFNSQAEYDHVQKLKAEIANLQSQIANFNGSDADLEALNGRLTELNDELNKSEISAAQNAANLGSLGPAAANASNKYYELTNKIKEQKIKVAELTIEHEKAKKAMKDANSSGNLQAITDARTKYDALSQALINARHQLTNYEIEQSKVAGGIKNDAFSINSIVSQLKSSAMSLAGGLGLALGAKEFVGQVVGIRGQFQQLEIAFETMLGSGEKAKELLGQLTETAAKTPFDLQGVAHGAKQLMAYGISADEVNDTLVHLGDIAAGLSLPLGDLVYLYGTTMTQGRMFTQDLRQFMGRGIPIAEELAKIFNTTKENVGALVTAGKVGANEFKQAIMAMSSEGGKFAGLMENQSKTITGQISNIQDSIDVMFNEIGKNSEGIINGTLDVVSSLVENYEKVGKVIAGVTATYGVYKGAVMAVIAVEKIQELSRLAHIKNITLLQLATDALTKKTAALNATMLTNPYVAVATAAAAVIASMISLGSEQDRVNDAYNRYIQEKNEAIAKEEEHKNKINELINIAENEGLTTDARRSAMLKIMAEYPELFKKYNTEIEALKDIYKWKAAIAEIDGKKSLKDTDNELSKVEKRINELEKKGKWSLSSTNSIAGSHTTSRTRTEEEELLALQRRRAELNKIKDNAKSEEYLKTLTGVSDADLQEQIKERKSLIAKMTASEKKYGKVNKGGATGVFDRKQIEKQIKQLEWEQNRRKEAVSNGSKDFVAEANKAYQKEKEAYDKLYSLSDPKKRAAQKGKIKIGEEEVDVSSPELWKTALDKQKKKMEEAKKAIPGDSSKGTGGKSGTNDATRNAKQLQDQWKHEQEMTKLATDAARAREDALIAAEQNASVRERKEREEQHKRAIEDIKRQEQDTYKTIYEQRKRQWELTHKDSPYENTAEGKAGYLSSDAREAMRKSFTDDEKKLFDAREEIRKAALDKENAEYARYTLERQNAELQAMRDYLKDYGTYEQQRLAITQEYEEKIKNAMEVGNTGEALSYQAKMDDEIKQLGFQQLQDNINWDQILSDFSLYSTEYLHTLQEQLETAVKLGMEQGIDAVNLKTLTDKLQEIKNQIANNGKGLFGSLFGEKGIMGGSSWGDVYQRIQQQRQLEEMARTAQSNANYAQNQYIEAQGNKGAAQLKYEEALEKFGENSKEAGDALFNLDKASQAAGDAQQAAAKASGEAAAAASKAAGGMKGMSIAIVDAIIHGVNQNLQSASKMVTEWGIGDEDFQRKFAKFAESSQYATAAFDSLKSGDIAGVVYNLGNAFNTLGESFGIWSNSNVEESEKQIDRLTKSNAELGKALNDLRDEMKDINLSDTSTYKKAQEVANAQIQNGLRVVQTKMGEYNGHHSTNYYSDAAVAQLMDIAYRAMNEGVIDKKYIGEGSKSFAPGFYVGGQDISNLLKYLTPEELDKLRTFDPDNWIKFMDALRDADKADLGAADTFLEYVDTYSDLMQDIDNQWKETITNLSWDSLKSSFASALEDMSKDIDDWSGDLNDIFRSGVSNYLSTSYTNKEDGMLAKWYEKYFQAMESGNLDSNEITQLREEYLAIVKSATDERDRLYETLGLADNAAREQQSATFNSAQNITYEQADSIVGINTAQLIALEQGNALKDIVIQNLATINQLATSRNNIVSEMRNLVMDGNNTRETILKVMKEHYENFTIQMNRIVTEIQNQ